MILRIIVIIFLLSPSIALSSSNFVELKDGGSKIDITNYISYLEDKSNDLSPDDLLKSDIQLKFQRPKKNKINYGFTTSTYWLRFSVKDLSSSDKWFLILDYPMIENIKVYKQQNNSLELIGEVSHNKIFPPVEISYPGRIFSINPIKNQKEEYYVQLKTRTTMRFPLAICSLNYLNKSLTARVLLNGIYLGIIFVMFLFNIFFYGTIRHYSSVFASLYIISFGLFVSLQNGTFWMIAPWFPVKHLLATYITSGLFVYIFSTLFGIYFLKTSENLPTIDKVLKIIIALCLSFIASLPFSSMSLMIKIFSGFGIIWSFANFIAGISSLLHGYRSARFFIAGWAFFFLSVTVFAIRGFGLFPSNTLTLYSIEIGSILVIFFLSIAISDQYYIIQKEHSKAQNIIIEKEKELSQVQKSLIENLNQISAFKDDLIKTTSSQLKTPLSSIIGITESLLVDKDISLSNKVTYNLKLILVSTKRLSRIIQNFIDYTQLKNEETQLNLSPVDIKPIVDILIDVINKLQNSSSVEIINKIPENFPFVIADKDRLTQAIFNLLYNISKLNPEIKIKIKSKIDSQDLTKACFIIQEEREGTLNYIIDSLIETESPMIKSVYNGSSLSGIELIIAKQIIELHGSKILIETKKDQGTIITFKLSIAKASSINSTVPKFTAFEYPEFEIQREEHKKAETIHQEKESRKNIVLADNDQILLKAIENNLTIEGYNVIIANDGQQVIDIIESAVPVDAVIIDALLPRINSLEVISKIRKKFSIAELPIIVISSLGEPENTMASFESGANDYLNKPFYIYEIVSRLKTQLQLKDAVNSIKRVSQIERELDIAREIQQSLIPQDAPKSDKFEIAHLYIPMDKVGGDYYDFATIDEDRIGIFIGDVLGHGMPAALIASMLKSIFNISHQFINNPVLFLKNINTALNKNLYDRFLTAMCIYIDFELKLLKVARAGHEPLFIHRRCDDIIHEFMPKGKLIGFSTEPNYELKEISLKSGDRIILYTDGISDFFDKDNPGEKKNFKNLIKKYKDQSAKEFISKTVEELKTLSSGQNDFGDDITLVAIDIK